MEPKTQVDGSVLARSRDRVQPPEREDSLNR